MKAMNMQFNLSLLALLAAATLAPLPVSAAPATTGMPIGSQLPHSRSTDGLNTLTDVDLGGISAKGLPDDLPYQFMDGSSTSNSGDRKVISELNSSLKSGTKFLDVETTLRDVVYDPTRATTFAHADGSITQILPNSIGEVSFDNIRVKGAEPGASFGSISIKAVNLNGTSLTLTPRH